jgi:hypothetical protein
MAILYDPSKRGPKRAAGKEELKVAQALLTTHVLLPLLTL